MIMQIQRSSYARWKHWSISFVLLVGCASLTGEALQAQDGYYGSATTGVESTGAWRWWPSWHFRSDGFPRYGRGFASSTRDHQSRIPAVPPISGPSYGFYQPCWRQMPTVRRCISCETMPSNREVPTLSGGLPSPSPTLTPGVTPLPPAPGTTSTDDPIDPEPEAPEPGTGF